MATLHHEGSYAHDAVASHDAMAPGFPSGLAGRPERRRVPDASALADALNERVSLARELHDGLLQSLTGITLQLDAIGHLVEQYPGAAREMLRELQEMVVEHQHDLRNWIENARHPAERGVHVCVDARAALERTCHRASRFGPRVEFGFTGCENLPASMFADVCRLVEEGLSNVRRHARARIARVEIVVTKRSIRLAIEDDGSGFPFRGRYDLPTLDSRRIGPASIKERVASLSGALVLTSSLSGARLDIVLPVPQERRLSRSAS